MQTLLQTQLDLSEMAARMFAELFAHVLGLAEPIFPLAFGEYAPILSVAHVLAVILFAGIFGLVGDQLRSSADLYKKPPAAAATVETSVEGVSNTSIGWAAVALAGAGLLATLVRYALLSYLAISVVLFVARLLVGGV